MTKFAHITSWENTQELTEKKLSTEHWDVSHYWKSKEDPNSNPLDISPVMQLLELALSEVMSPDQSRSSIETIKKSMIGYKYTSELLKEFTFEEVRKEFFPDRPSRKRCMFALPEGSDIELFRAKFGLTKQVRKNVVLIEPINGASNVFVADALLLNCNTLPVEEIREKARAYWNGSGTMSLPEVLIEGEFQIIRSL
ncbi:MAG: DUF2441 domain-containing protein [Gammaproteobacteria bacterium]|jgi:hypothetical protein